MSRLWLLLPLLLVGCNSTEVRNGDRSTAPVARAVLHAEAQQLIFFAVLEGLYRDGADTRIASVIAEIEEPAGIPRYFVYACPICTPALDAFRLYVTRPGFYRDKQGRDTFGPGLDPAVRRALLSADPVERRDALEQLISRWIDEKIASSNFDQEQREALSMAFKEMRKKGMELLQQFQADQGPDGFLDSYRDWQRCPSCDGANEE